MTKSGKNLDERDHARAGVSELLQRFDLFVEPLGEIERLKVEGQKKASGFAHHGGLSRPVTKMAITLARPKFARQEAQPQGSSKIPIMVKAGGIR
ncbi:hypothetical protein [Aeromonas veronii]|uniref:hypothetical protein n=1 Tax=Aeromonas veronii TaxID=654 RepID=UPI0030073699